MQAALALTWETLNARMRLLRFAAAGALAIAAASLLLSLILRTPWGLAGSALLLPLGYAFVLSDMRKVYAWEAGIHELRESGGLDLEVFVQALEMQPSPFKRSVLEMARALKQPPDPGTVPGTADASPSRSPDRRRRAEIRLARSFCRRAGLACGALSLAALASGAGQMAVVFAAAAGALLCAEACAWAAAWAAGRRTGVNLSGPGTGPTP